MLFGRDGERNLIGGLLDAAREARSGALVVRGEPGVGKTALLLDARERAAGMHVLMMRGVESESELPFAGLHQLLRPALTLIDLLPPPQARALEGALGLSTRAADDRFLVSVACLTLLSELAEQRPVLCLVDDAQWIDTPSADALLFVARRVEAEGIVILFGAREGDERRFDAPGLPELALAGLDDEAALALLANGARELTPAVRDLLLRQAAGNALALVELPAALTAEQVSGDAPLPDTLPLTRDLERLFLVRVRKLPPDTQRVLLLIAADDSGTLAPALRAANALALDPHALQPAEQAGLVSVRGERVDVRHPLVRSAVYQAASSGERRAAHLALADALSDQAEADRRAWHLAAAALGPDEPVAEELERSADRARSRSGHAAAAAALERAAELSEDDDAKARRFVAAAEEAWHAGQPDRSGALLDRVEPLVSGIRLRADVDYIRGAIGLRCGSLLDAGAVLIDGAVAVAPVDPAKAFEMLVDAGSVAGRSGHVARLVEVARLVAALPAAEDDQDRVLTDLLVGVGSIIGGESSHEVARIAGAVDRALESDDPRLLSWAATGASTVGDEQAEAALVRRAIAVARRLGAVDSLALILETAVSSAVVGGRYGHEAEATEGLRLAQETGLTNTATSHRAALAWVAALRGEDDDCRAYVAEVTDAVRTSHVANAASTAEWALAMLELSAGRPEATIARLEAMRCAPLGAAHPFFVVMSVADHVEACVRAGRHEDAPAAFAPLEHFTQAGGPPWALAHAARCRGLMAQDPEVAERELGVALEWHAKGNRAFDTARTELLLGELLRRERRRVDARGYLRSALDTFESMQARHWAERARSELRASGETARRRDPSTVSQLTPQEQQVAGFVAEGLSNKEVAAQLFLSPRTIDAHLRNIFAKLGITSRTQLAGMFAAGRLSLVQ